MQSEMNLDPFAKLKTDGDVVERQFADRIHDVIPSYARIWAEYVGNDGSAKALPMSGAGDAATDSRAMCWQRLYTIFESLVLCWDIEEELGRLQEIRDFKSYAQNLNLWIAFYSHLGRMHDMVKTFAGELRKPELLQPFVEFWKNRHIVLHGPKVPMKWVYNTLAVPPLGDRPKYWNDKMVWQDLKAHDFELVAEEVSVILRDLEKKLERCLTELRKILPSKYDWKPVSWSALSKKATFDVNSQVLSNPTTPASEQIPATGWLAPSGTEQNISASEGD